ncbi:DNA (cytosine-5-)-methyltransferase [Luteolibacter ambystomatis]|uniref:DNA (cytosine-5-)-methyltransferase n=2 Tax=Luteolibacter ambystomatis TaxID=2824561 RepID=A0A975IYT7_9BACT|nr:DNA (cytosine-5-)-methyltransferase [Luteolibacter ambystomatis]
MARAGLGAQWLCQFSNDFDQKKGETYAANWGGDTLRIGDVKAVKVSDLPGEVDLVWASFPCQDLSLAGGGAGLLGERSGTFWPFWKLIQGLVSNATPPRMIVLENVCGALTSHGGKDFSAICSALAKAGYQFGALVIDAAHFVPQSRPRLFVVACRSDVQIPPHLQCALPEQAWHSKPLVRAFDLLPKALQKAWIWWSLPFPTETRLKFGDLIEDEPADVEWHSRAETQKLLSMMSPINRAKVEAAKKTGARMVGTIYKRTRPDENGVKAQRAEIRFDDISGCLRTPAGGSSRQVVMLVHGESVKSRLISARETARLMGLPDNYKLPSRYNEAYHLTGDGVVVPVVRHLAKHLLEPLILRHRVSASPKKAA